MRHQHDRPASPAELEKGLIGAMWGARPRDVDTVLGWFSVSDFTSPVAGRAFLGIRRMRELGYQDWEVNTLIAHCEITQEWLKEAVIMSPDRLLDFAAGLRDAALARQLRKICSAGAQINPARGEVCLAAHQVITELEALGERASDLTPTDMQATTLEILESMETGAAGAALVTMGEAFRHVTDAIDGLYPGRYYILGAVPGTGKTAVALHWAFHGAKRPLFVTSEMRSRDLLARLMSHLSGVSESKIHTGRGVTPDDRAACVEARARIMDSGLDILEAFGKTPSEIAASVMEVHRHRKYDLVVHDYLQLMRPPRASMSEYETVAHASEAMMVLTKRLHPAVPVLQLAQLNRRLEQRDDPEPRMSDLRGSGTIEQDADGIFLLHRPANYPKAPRRSPFFDDPSALMVKMVKHRFGPPGAWFVQTDSAYRFRPHPSYAP